MSRVIVLAKHFYIAAKWQDPDSIDRFSATPAQLVAADVEADHELFDLNAAKPRNEIMAELVDENHRAQADRDFYNNADPPPKVGQADHGDQVHTQRATSWRAQRSSSWSCSSVGSGSKWCASSTLLQAGTISVKCSSPCKNASTAASFAAFSTAPLVPPRRAQS